MSIFWEKLNVLRHNRLLVISLVFFVVFSYFINRAFATPIYDYTNVITDPGCDFDDVDCTVSNFPDDTGHAGEFLRANGSGVLTWDSLVAAVDIGSSIASGTPKSVLFIDADGELAEDPVNFVWDYSTNRLGIGTNTPASTLDVNGTINAATEYDLAGDFFATQDDGNGYIRIGKGAGNGTMSGGNNVLLGINAGAVLDTGYMNLFIGNNAGNSTTTGSENIFIGPYAGFSNIDGEKNIFVGKQSGESNTAGDENTYLGYYTGNIATGSGNTLLGYRAGDNITTGSNNIIIGHDIEAPIAAGNPGEDNQLSIGNLIFGTDVDGTGTTLSAGNIGIGTNSPDFKLEVAGDVSFLDSFGGLTPGIDLFRQGDLSGVVPGTDNGFIFFVGEALGPGKIGYQKTDYNFGNPTFSIVVDNESNNANFGLDSATGAVSIESDPAGDLNSYLNFNAAGSIDLRSDISATVNSSMSFESTGDVGIFSNTAADISSSIELGSTVVGNATNAAGISASFMLDPDGFSLIEVDDQDDDGRFGVSANSANGVGASIYHIRDLGPGDVLDDVVTYYWQGQIWHRVVTDTAYDQTNGDCVTDELNPVYPCDHGDAISNDFYQDGSGFHFNYHTDSGTLLTPSTDTSTLLINDDFTFNSGVGGDIMTLTNDNGTCTFDPFNAGSWICPSDMNLKKDITTLDSGLAEILELRPVTYRFRSEDESVSVSTGLIAQEVEPIFPKLVKHQDNGTLGLNYGGLTPFMIKAIQEMHVELVGVKEFTDETFILKLREWLGSVSNGIEKIFAGRVETYELQTDKLCVGSRCITEAEFIQLLDANGVSGSGGGSTPPQDNPPVDDGGSGDSGTPPVDEGTPPIPDEVPPPTDDGGSGDSGSETPPADDTPPVE